LFTAIDSSNEDGTLAVEREGDRVAYLDLEIECPNRFQALELKSDGRDDDPMNSRPLSELLTLPAADRAELAIALWESPTDSDRGQAVELFDE